MNKPITGSTGEERIYSSICYEYAALCQFHGAQSPICIALRRAARECKVSKEFEQLVFDEVGLYIA